MKLATAFGTSEEAQLHQSPWYPKNIYREPSSPIPSCKNVWKHWKYWRRSSACNSMNSVLMQKKSIFSRTPLWPTLMKPSILISLSWPSHRTDVLYIQAQQSHWLLCRPLKHQITGNGDVHSSHVSVNKTFLRMKPTENPNKIKIDRWTSALVFKTRCYSTGSWHLTFPQPDPGPQFTLMDIHG